jgi:hypothetical protein
LGAIWQSSLQMLTCCCFWSAVRNCIRPDTWLQIKGRERIGTSTQLCEIVYIDSQDKLVLSSTIASCYYNWYTDGSFSAGNYRYHLVYVTKIEHTLQFAMKAYFL